MSSRYMAWRLGFSVARRTDRRLDRRAGNGSERFCARNGYFYLPPCSSKYEIL
jgi:hypothetical protein